MKLFCDVFEADCPSAKAPFTLPSTNEPLWMACGDKVVPVASFPPAAAAPPFPALAFPALAFPALAFPPFPPLLLLLLLLFCADTTAPNAAARTNCLKSILKEGMKTKCKDKASIKRMKLIRRGVRWLIKMHGQRDLLTGKIRMEREFEREKPARKVLKG
jgi:hypothetical protein